MSLRRGTPLKERFRITPEGCWEWLGGVESDGYAIMKVRMPNWEKSRPVRVLRWFMAVRDFRRGVMYDDLWPAIRDDGGYGPPDKDADHTCYNRRCVNPEHGAWATKIENRNRRRRDRRKAHRKPRSTRHARIPDWGADDDERRQGPDCRATDAGGAAEL